jgi:hypothetical protein
MDALELACLQVLVKGREEMRECELREEGVNGRRGRGGSFSNFEV